MTATTPHRPAARPSHWLCILCLIGLDYFSSLAYQPSMAFEAVQRAAPLVTIAIVLATLLGALPVYAYVAGRSPHGQGATGLLERTVPGWPGKLLVLILLGFAATDFVLTKTLSIADAAEHLIHNPFPPWQHALDVLASANAVARQLLPDRLWQRVLDYWNRRLVVAVLLSILSFTFWAVFRRGFTRRVIQLAVLIVTVYLLLNAVVVGSGLYYLAQHPDLLAAWWAEVVSGPGPAGGAAARAWLPLVGHSLLSFPKLSLGLSGFELSMVVLPFIKEGTAEDPSQPGGRLAGARKLLLTAAILMSLYLLGSALVTTLLIPPQALAVGGPAANRALAYLAHGGPLATGGGAVQLNPLFGQAFGTVYDLSTVVILCLAGSSVTLGLRHLVPQSLHRLGMELEWAHRTGAILHLLNAINLVVIVLFRASVSAQRGAYATSVLTLIAGAALAAALDRRRPGAGAAPGRVPWGFALISAGFLAAAAAAIVWDPDGLLIALGFVLAIVVFSFVSRALRSTELRFEGFRFKDPQSQFLWESLKYLEFPILVPHHPGRRSLLLKEGRIRQKHRLAPDVPVVFVEAELGDASDFYQKPLLEVTQEEGRFLIRASGCASIAHVLAAVALELSKVGKPPEVHFGWSDESPVSANVSFLLFGQGNVPWMVHDLIRRAESDPERRPSVIIG